MRRLSCNHVELQLFLGLIPLLGSPGQGPVCIPAFLVLALAVPTALTVAVSRSITIRIRSVGNAASDLSQGKLSVVLDDQQRRDEIGDLRGRFRAIAEYLKEMSELSSAIANGNLTILAEPHSADDVLSHAFRHMTEGLSGIVRSVRSAATQVAAGADQVAAASRETAQASFQVSTSISGLASAID